MRIKELVQHAIDDNDIFEKIEEIKEVLDELNKYEKSRLIGEFEKYLDELKNEARKDDICPECGISLDDADEEDACEYCVDIVADRAREAAEYQANPMQYFGMSQRDFI